MVAENIHFPEGLTQDSIDYRLSNWFKDFVKFGAYLHELSNDKTDFVRTILLSVPQRNYVSTALCYGFINSFLHKQSENESDSNYVSIENLQVGMTIAGFRTPINGAKGEPREFMAKITDLSQIKDITSPKIGMEVKGYPIRYWHIDSLSKIRVINLKTNMDEKIGFYSEDTKYGTLPWKWLLGKKGREIREFQDPVINLRGSKEELINEWSNELYWVDDEKIIRAPIERILCPLKSGIPGPFFVDASLTERHIDLRRKSYHYEIQILDSVNSIKNNLELPSSDLVVAIVSRAEMGSRSVVEALNGFASNGREFDVDTASLSNTRNIEVASFGVNK